jgi:phytoene dehydrogenase-like protein
VDGRVSRAEEWAGLRSEGFVALQREMVKLCALVVVGVAVVVVLGCAPCHGESQVCVVGSGMGGASVAYFLREYAPEPLQIAVFEARDRVGGRMAVVELEGETFEAGASVIHPKNLHAVKFASLLELNRTSDDDDDDEGSFGIWDGTQLVFQTARAGDSLFSKTVTRIMNTLSVLWRYGASLWRMQNHVNVSVARILKPSGLGFQGFRLFFSFSDVVHEELFAWDDDVCLIHSSSAGNP